MKDHVWEEIRPNSWTCSGCGYELFSWGSPILRGEKVMVRVHSAAWPLTSVKIGSGHYVASFLTPDCTKSFQMFRLAEIMES